MWKKEENEKLLQEEKEKQQKLLGKFKNRQLEEQKIIFERFGSLQKALKIEWREI